MAEQNSAVDFEDFALERLMMWSDPTNDVAAEVVEGGCWIEATVFVRNETLSEYLAEFEALADKETEPIPAAVKQFVQGRVKNLLEEISDAIDGYYGSTGKSLECKLATYERIARQFREETKQIQDLMDRSSGQ